MYIISYLVNEIHLNYFIMILTILITTAATCLISLILRLFGINDSIENDKKILRSFGMKSKKSDEKMKDENLQDENDELKNSENIQQNEKNNGLIIVEDFNTL